MSELCDPPSIQPSAGQPSQPGADCTAPLFVHVCSTDVAQIDTEYVCDETTDTWHRIDIIDGIAQPPIDTGIPCSDPPPADPEIVRECVDGFVNHVFYSVAADGTWTETGRVVTGEECGTPQVISVKDLCLPSTVAAPLPAAVTPLGAASDFAGAVEPYTAVTAAPPSPDGTTAIYAGTAAGNSYTVEMIDWVAGSSPSAYTRRNLTIETPVSQGGASLGVAGFDQTTGSSLNRNGFVISMGAPVQAWAASFLDTESATVTATLELYDAAETLLVSSPIVWPGSDGSGDITHLSFTRPTADVAFVVVAVGANTSDPNVNNNRVAFGNMQFVLPPTEDVVDGYCLTASIVDGVKVETVYAPNGQPVTDQTVIDALVDCEPPPPCDIVWEWRDGCVAGDPNYDDGTRVRWVEGLDCEGNPVIPDSGLQYFRCVPYGGGPTAAPGCVLTPDGGTVSVNVSTNATTHTIVDDGSTVTATVSFGQVNVIPEMVGWLADPATQMIQITVRDSANDVIGSYWVAPDAATVAPWVNGLAVDSGTRTITWNYVPRDVTDFQSACDALDTLQPATATPETLEDAQTFTIQRYMVGAVVDLPAGTLLFIQPLPETVSCDCDCCEPVDLGECGGAASGTDTVTLVADGQCDPTLVAVLAPTGGPRPGGVRPGGIKGGVKSQIKKRTTR